MIIDAWAQPTHPRFRQLFLAGNAARVYAAGGYPWLDGTGATRAK